MLTIFAAPKPFRGHIGTIQRNAIASWTQLRPACQVLLFGDEEGTEETAEAFGIRHVPKVLKNLHGTPLVSDLFAQAELISDNDLLCLINCDILLMRDFMAAVARVKAELKRFLMIGECVNVDLEYSVRFERDNWEAEVRALLAERGKPRGPLGIDYFVFPRGLYGDLPPFALGRAFFDNWLIWKAKDLPAAVVDATAVVTAVHQNHSHGHVPGGRDGAYQGPEAMENLELAGGGRHIYLTVDASHRLEVKSIERNWGSFFRIPFCRQMARMEHKPFWKVFATEVLWLALDCTRNLRRKIGLDGVTLKRLRKYLSGS